MLLHESVNTCDSLELVIKAIVNEHYSLMAMVLEVQTFTKHFRLCSEILQTTFLKVQYVLIRFIVILTAIDCLTTINSLAECHTLRFEVMPQKEVVVYILRSIDYLHDTLNLCRH